MSLTRNFAPYYLAGLIPSRKEETGGCDRGPNADRPAASLEMVYFCPIQNHTQTINNIDFMGKILVVGAGGVSTVAVKKMAMNADVFTDIMLASRTKSK